MICRVLNFVREVCEKTFVTDPHLAEHVTTEHTVVSEFLTWILTISEQLGKRDLESLEKDHLTPPDYNKLLAINLISTIILTISILIISCTLRGNYDIDFDISLMFQCFFAHAHLRSGEASQPIKLLSWSPRIAQDSFFIEVECQCVMEIIFCGRIPVLLHINLKHKKNFRIIPTNLLTRFVISPFQFFNLVMLG